MLFALILVAQLALPSASPSPTSSATPTVLPSPTASPSPTSSAPPLFRPPAGWKQAPVPSTPSQSQLSFVGYFMSPGGTAGKGTFNVLSAPNALSMDDTVKITISSLKARYNGFTLIDSHEQPLCGAERGWYLDYDRLQNGTKLRTLQTIALSNGRAYIATYVFLADRGKNAAAVAALQSLCAPPDVALADLGAAPITPPDQWRALNLDAARAKLGDALPMWGFMSPLHGDHASVIMTFTMATNSMQSEDSEMVEGDMQKGMRAWASDIKVLSKDSVTLCGAEGLHYRMSAAFNHIPMTIDAIVSAGAPTSYVSMYMRHSTDPDDPAAQTSIRTLCPADRQSAG